MGAVALRFASEARQRWRSWVLLAVVSGLAAGGALAALAGARRTETAYRRFVEGTRGYDALVTNGSSPELFNRQFDFDEVRALEQVAESAPVAYYFPNGETPSGRPFGPTAVTPFAPVDGRFGTELNRAEVLEGRLPEAVDELAVAFLAAEQLDLEVGDDLQLSLTGPASFLAAGGEEFGGPPTGPPPTRPFRVVGVIAMQGGFPPLSPSGGVPPMLLLSAAYAEANPDFAEVLAVRLRRHRSDVPAFTSELERQAGGTQVITLVEEEQTTAVESRGLDVQATVLRLLAVVLAGVTVLLAGQALSRQVLMGSADHHLLGALGFTSGQRRALGLARAVVVAAGASVVAVVTAVALSPLSPVGTGRKAELDRGVDVDVTVLGLGALAVVVLVLLAGAVAARWATRGGRPAAGRASPLVGALARAGAPALPVSGVRLALEPGHGPTAVPVRSTILGAALGVATLAGVLAFTGSIGHLFDRPPLYGWNWDVQVGSAFSPELASTGDDIASDPDVREVALAAQARLQVDGRPVDTIGLQPVEGTIPPTVVEGRAPAGPSELLLGTRTLRALGLSVGDRVDVAYGARTERLDVVGRGVLSEFAGAARLGEGAAMTMEALRRLVPDAVRNTVLVRARPGADVDALAQRLQEAYTIEGVYLPATPSDLADLERIGSLPFVVAGLLGLMALTTLAHTLGTSVRRRRRDLAVLKVLGFVRSQVTATVAWQSSTLAVLAGLVGVPLGLAAGRAAWDVFADRLGVPPRPVTPVLAAVLLVLALVLLANLVAALPARVASRTRPADALRAE